MMPKSNWILWDYKNFTRTWIQNEEAFRELLKIMFGSLKLKSLDKLQLKLIQNLKAFCHWVIEINSCKLHMIYDLSRVNFHWSWFHIERHLISHKSKLTRKSERIHEPQHNSSEYWNQKLQTEHKLQFNLLSSWTPKLWSYQTFWSAELWIEKALKLQKSTEFHTKAKVKVRFQLSFNFIASRNFFRRARDLLHILDHESC